MKLLILTYQKNFIFFLYLFHSHVMRNFSLSIKYVSSVIFQKLVHLFYPILHTH